MAGTIKIGADAVSMSRGRGAARVTMTVSFKELERWARLQQIDTGKLMTQSFWRACSGLKKKFRQVMQNAGGVCGVPKFKDFEEFTKTLREASHNSRPMGGVLADEAYMFGGRSKSTGAYFVGWKDYMESAARKFQEGIGGDFAEMWFTDNELRHSWHQRGIKEIPHSYVHNERRVMPEPFGEYVRENLEEWARGAFYKDLARQFQKGAVA